MTDNIDLTEAESRIRNTTSMVDDGDADADQEYAGTCSTCGSTFTCSSSCCNNALLNRCSSCMSALEHNLMDAIDNLVTENAATGVESSEMVAPNLPTDAPVNVDTTVEPGSKDLPPSIESIEVLLMLAANASNKKFSIMLNDINEEFSLISDPINRSLSKRLCIKLSNTKDILYWYNYVGILSGNQSKFRKGPRMLVAGATILIRNSTDKFVLSDILETRCNKPRYDGLVVNLRTKEAAIIKNIPQLVEDIDFETKYNLEDIKSCVHKYLTISRWYFIAERGLSRECRTPQLPDSELQKYMIRVVNDTASPPNKKNPFATPVSKQDQKKKLKIKATKKGKVQKTPPLFIESDLSDSEDSPSVLSIQEPPRKRQKVQNELSQKSPTVPDVKAINAMLIPLPEIHTPAPLLLNPPPEIRAPAPVKVDLPSASYVSPSVEPSSTEAATFSKNMVNAHASYSNIDFTSTLNLIAGAMFDSQHNSWRAQEYDRRERELERREAELRRIADRSDFQSQLLSVFKQINSTFR